ncbi:MAG: hypothetical protein QXD36_05920 [Sulfolobales archaeon]
MFGVRITYVYQGKPLRTAHTVSPCGEFTNDNDFIIYLGVTYLKAGLGISEGV